MWYYIVEQWLRALKEEIMSQEKVDKKKYLKKHRKEIERKKKAKTIISCVVVCLFIGAIIGVPAGINAYKNMPKFVGDKTLEAYVGTYLDENYAEEIALVNSLSEKADSQDDNSSDE